MNPLKLKLFKHWVYLILGFLLSFAFVESLLASNSCSVVWVRTSSSVRITDPTDAFSLYKNLSLRWKQEQSYLGNTEYWHRSQARKNISLYEMSEFLKEAHEYLNEDLVKLSHWSEQIKSAHFKSSQKNESLKISEIDFDLRIEEVRSNIRQLIDEISKIEENKYRYGDIIEFTIPLITHFTRFENLEMKLAVGLTHPIELTENLGYQSGRIEMITNEHPLSESVKYFILPTFKPLSLRDINITMGSGVHYMGISRRSVVADGAIFDPLLFGIHDWFHARVASFKFANEQQVLAFQKLREKIDLLMNSDPALAVAIEISLFIIMHENGYNIFSRKDFLTNPLFDLNHRLFFELKAEFINAGLPEATIKQWLTPDLINRARLFLSDAIPKQ